MASGGCSKTHQSAIIVMPPNDSLVYQAIQSIRREHDKQYHRWMPHVNMIYPFYHQAEFDNAAAKLAPILATVPPFVVKLARFDCFSHGSNGATVWLDPQVESAEDGGGGGLIGLQALLTGAFPECTEQQARGGFHPHLTVSQCANGAEAAAKIRQFGERWKPGSFLVRSVELISRDGPDNPFVIRHSLPLGGAESSLS